MDTFTGKIPMDKVVMVFPYPDDPFLDGNYSFWAYFMPSRSRLFTIRYSPSSGSAGEVLGVPPEQKQDSKLS